MLVGRERELDRLAGALAEDRPCLVIGESGVGKSTLLTAAVDRDGRPVFAGGALSTLSWLDYHALDRALGRPACGADPAAVAAEVESAVAAGILLLDDLQWAAAPTLAAVGLLAGRLSILVGIRTGDSAADRAVEQLAGAGFETLELTGLDQEQSVALVHQLHSELGPQAAARLAIRVGGNPLLLRELAASGEPSASLRLSIQARLRRLDESDRDAFALLAMLGRPLQIDLLGPGPAKSLRNADLIVAAGADRVELRHALLGEIAVADLDDERRRRIHAAIARLVDDPGEAARHHQLANEPHAAYENALAAARLAGRAGERASHLALAAACADGPETTSLRLEAAYALEEAHDWPALTVVLGQLAAAEPEARAAAALIRARASWRAGDPEGLRSAIEEGLALTAGSGNPTEVELLVEKGRIPIFLDRDPEAAVCQTAQALRLAADGGMDLARALYLHGTALYTANSLEAAGFLERAIEAARAGADLGTELLAANNLITLHESDGDPALARRLAEEYAERSRQRGLAVWERSFRVALSNLAFHAGRYDEVLATADELLDVPLEARTRDALLEQLCVSLVDLGRHDEALRRLDAESDRPGDWTWQRQAMWVRCEAALWGGAPAQALTTAADLLAGPGGDHNIAFAVVSQAWARHDLDQPIEPPAPAPGLGMLAAVPHEVDGLRHLQAGRAEEALVAFERAVELWTPYHRRGALRCDWAAAEAARRADHPDAVERLLESERRAAATGMVPLTNRVVRSLRATGVNRAAARSRRPDQLLSGRQREVLRLVAAGLTNAEIAARLGVSRHTVVSQISGASIKLDADTRAQAAAVAVRLGLV